MGAPIVFESFRELCDTKIIDLSKCKPGQKLISKHGMILEYVGPIEKGHYYDHYVKYPDKSIGTRTNDGFVYRKNRSQVDHDIVEIVPFNKDSENDKII